jgi:hypothetical protein
LAAASGAPSCDSFTKPLIADVLGINNEIALMNGGIASLGQEKPATMKSGRPSAAKIRATLIGLRKMPATTKPSPATESTNGTAKIKIGNVPPNRGKP